MTVLGIDPGSSQSAWVLWDGERVLQHGKEANDSLLRWLPVQIVTHVVIEQIASYGMPVGAEVFATVHWAGRFYESVVNGHWKPTPHQIPRRDVKLHLCGQARAKDSNIRQALIDKFGGKEAAIGRKAKQGPLYGIKADEWAALALAITFMETRNASVVEGVSA